MKIIFSFFLSFFILLQISEAQDYYVEKNGIVSQEKIRIKTERVIKRLQHRNDTIFYCSIFDEFTYIWLHDGSQCIEYNIYRNHIDKKKHSEVWSIYLSDSICEQYFTYKWANDVRKNTPCFPDELLGGESIRVYIKGEKRPLFCPMILECIYVTEFDNKSFGAYIQQIFRDLFKITISGDIQHQSSIK